MARARNAPAGFEPGTATGFVSALVLPVVLWLLQRALTRVGF